MVAKFLSPDREIVSRFGDCLPFGDMSLPGVGVYGPDIWKISKIVYKKIFKEHIHDGK